MIAELHGKTSSSNLRDRLEVNLTGDVFGALGYLPFHVGMSQILCAAKIDGLCEYVSQTTPDFWGNRIQFWPHHKDGEMDGSLELDDL